MGISTHVLDTARGLPAARISVTLSLYESDRWSALTTGETDSNGRCASLLADEQVFAPGLYRLHFDTASYFSRSAVETLYPFVEITFEVRAGQRHYHIPLLLTPHSYTTYRGS